MGLVRKSPDPLDQPRTGQRLSAHGHLLVNAAVFTVIGIVACRGMMRRGPPTEALRMTVPDSGGPLEFTLPEEGLVLHLGPRETLLEADKLPGVRFFPDIGTVVLQRSPVRALMAAGNIPLPTQLVTGADWKHLTSARPVLAAGDKEEFDNGGAAITGVYHHRDGRMFGVYYTEDAEGIPSRGFYASNGLAVSSDSGETWTKLGRIIASSRTKEWVLENHVEYGGAATSGAIVSPDDAWWYVYYSERFRAEFPFMHICVARHRVSAEAPAPGTFFKYHKGAFDQPGLGGLCSPVVSLEGDSLNVGSPHVTWVAALHSYVMMVDILNRPENQLKSPLSRDGTGISFSRDGINWSKPRQLWVDYTVPIVGKSLSWETTLVLDGDNGLDGWLLYSHSSRWGSPPVGIPHHLVGRRFSFRRVPAR